MICNLCPRHCNALRTQTQGQGFCGMGTQPVIARAARHFWEEPCISGDRGSGTVFFCGCSLGCLFCQNHSISHGELQGRRLTATELSELFTRVEAMGVHNLNLVSPSHFAPAVLEALALRKPNIPVVWNSSGYESPETIREARGLVDVFLPDLKYAKATTAAQLASAPDYFPVALAAIRAMCEQTGAPVYDAAGMMLSGTLVRHLVLPMRVDETITLLNTIASELPPGTPVSLMRQYTPMNGITVKGMDRRLTEREYARARDQLFALGLDGYLQQKEAATSAFTPAFMDEESTLLFSDLGHPA
ncbi:MAG TPA: radical SAM protein [Candidatus Limiplasma sp.]|nr:radical SAM protein [Candidatus Limiplasma sp.]HPS82425.1 radical SAM protein [Candidatus Limiplasma sp.]